MKINKVVIRRFKRFEHTEFTIPNDTIVFAGPNNTGKTTLLQAIAAWSLAMQHWLEFRDYKVRKGYVKVPLTRQAFYSVPLRNFNLLWHGGNPSKKDVIQIEIFFDDICCNMEFIYDTTEQIYVRPVYKDNAFHKEIFKQVDAIRWWLPPRIVYVPAMTGITMAEPFYQPAKIDELLGQGRPGEVLRNLLALISDPDAWDELRETMRSLFGYDIQPPEVWGANITAEYIDNNGMRLDIASAGSGFLQVLMLLTFLSIHTKSVLLLDEPDAHLHILLQDKVFLALKDFARVSDSTLIMATHSERIINAAEPRDLSVVLDHPKPIADTDERAALITSLTALDNSDIMLAQNAKGILYVEGHTDISLLRAWAEALNHRLLGFLGSPFWKPTVYQPADKGKGIQAEAHYDAVRLAADIRGLELRDSDGHERFDKELDNGLKRIFWRRYEIESYLIHSDAVARIAETIGEEGAGEKARAYVKDQLPPAVYKNPLEESEYINITKAKKVIDNAMQAAGIYNFKDYYRIAERMDKEEIHPEVIEKLDAIAEHFGIPKE